MDKGAPHAKKKKAHIETETDKVTQQGDPDGEGEPESVLVITVFTFPLSSFILYLFTKERSFFTVFFLPINNVVLVLDVTSATSSRNANKL